MDDEKSNTKEYHNREVSSKRDHLLVETSRTGSTLQSHGQELEQNFGLLSICGIAVATGESWIVLGNSIVCITVMILLEWKFFANRD
jgi:hypothetical protein